MVWYYMAFFAISVAMLGMTAGAVWVYLHNERLKSVSLPVTLTRFALATAVAIPASIMMQFCIVTKPAFSLTTVVAWSLMLIAMTVPYFFSGIVVSLALTRSPFPTGQVYGVDLLGAAVGCLGVIFLLNLFDGPTSIFVLGVIGGFSAIAFAASAIPEDQAFLKSLSWWKRPVPVTLVLAGFALLNAIQPFSGRPILVKDSLEVSPFHRFERWNSYSRVVASDPYVAWPLLWGPSPKLSPDARAPQIALNIDGTAGTFMVHYDGSPQSISFLQYDLVSLAYRLPGIHKSAVIGVGGGRDLMTAHYFGVPDITGVELNPIFVNLLTRNPSYSRFANVNAVPNLKLHVDDARSWFASTHEHFDLIQMSMIDTWAATGAGAFTLSENGLYTLEGWRAFLSRLNENGIFTVSRWYSYTNVDETGRMIGLATAALIDSGIRDPSSHIFVARANNIATLVLSKRPFTPEQLQILHHTVDDLQFRVLLAPDQPARSPLLAAIASATDHPSLDRALQNTDLDITVSTDNRPFFFNQLRFLLIPRLALSIMRSSFGGGGTVVGNLIASAVLLLILFISIIAVIITVIVPLRGAISSCSRPLVVRGTLYFSLIGMGFMLAEIALLQRFSVYLGHPIYSLSVSLFSLILSTGLGSLASDRIPLNGRGRLLAWAGLLVTYILVMNQLLPVIFNHTTSQERLIRILISIAVIMPLGFLLGFAFPTGMRLVEAVDSRPTPWFWGINGATGVLASVLAIMSSMALGIKATMLISALCYLTLVPVALALLRMKQPNPEASMVRGQSVVNSQTA
jgi:predicted membrane-bound spermidine synthase